MPASPPLRRLVTAVLVLTLPLLASQCSKKSQQVPSVQGLTTDQSEKFQALHAQLGGPEAQAAGTDTR